MGMEKMVSADIFLDQLRSIAVGKGNQPHTSGHQRHHSLKSTLPVKGSGVSVIVLWSINIMLDVGVRIELRRIL